MERLKINTALYTKDGRIFGNAIVTGMDNETISIITDYGNEARLTVNEINKYFHIGKINPTHKHAVKYKGQSLFRCRCLNITCVYNVSYTCGDRHIKDVCPIHQPEN